MAVKKQAKNAGGRPTVFTPEAVSKLDTAFSLGANAEEACCFAGVSTPSFYRHMKENEEFRERIEMVKHKLPLKAKGEMAKLIHSGDKQTVLWYLERKCKSEFSVRTETEHGATSEVLALIADIRH